MKYFIKLLLSCWIILLNAPVFGEELQLGTVHRDSLNLPRAQEIKIWDLEDIAYEKNISQINSIVAYISPVGLQTNFVLDRNLFLAEINLAKKSVNGPWPLTRWEHLYIPEEEKRTYANIGLNEDSLYRPSHSSSHPGLGCFGRHPLRYGQLTEDTETMLVLLLGSEFILFSPAYERVVFMEFLNHSDWLAEEQGNAMRGEYPYGDTDAQYLSASYSAIGDAEPGMRGYAKVYLGDYDEDGHADIVVWRKFYASNGRREVFGNKPVKGFSLSRNEWQHYERDLVAQKALPAGVTGEYLPQETAQETVRSWLVKGGLTWQSGFPSKSECAGEEGELIPAMHDPLLNDPQVMH